MLKNLRRSCIEVVFFIACIYGFSGCAGVILAGAGASGSVTKINPHSKKSRKEATIPTLKVSPIKKIEKYPR